MSHITVPEIDAWLDSTKFDLKYVEVTIEEHIANITLSALSKSFPIEVPTWVDEVTTPDLVRTVISMRYAAAVYRRQYAEVSERMPSYPANLDRMANDLLEGILSGDLDLLDVDAIPPSQQPDFYPKDNSGIIRSTGAGNVPASSPLDDFFIFDIGEGDGQKFKMGKVF